MADSTLTTGPVRPAPTHQPDGVSRSEEVERHSDEFEIDDTPATSGAETTYPEGMKLFTIVFTLLVILISVGFDVTVVAVTVPSISNEFHALSHIGWYSTSTRVAWCSFIFAWAKAYTVFDVKVLFIAGIAIRMVGQIVTTFSPTSVAFIIGRFIDGLGLGGVMNGTFVIFTQTLPSQKRPFWMGVAGLAETLSSLSAPLIGGALIDGWTWRACYGINIPISLLAVLICWYNVDLQANPNTHLQWTEKLQRLDLVGATIFIPATVSLLVALQWAGSQFSWTDPRVITLFVLSIILYTAFGYVQYRKGEHASIPPRIIKIRSLYAGAIYNFCFNAASSTVEYYMSIYFQSVQGYSAARSGVFALPMIAGMSIACIFMGTGVSAIGYYYPFMWTGAILASVATGLLTTVDVDTGLAKTLLYQALLGAAVGLGVLGPQMAVQSILDPKEVSIGISIIQFGQQMGPVIAVASSTAVFTNRLVEELTTHDPDLDAAAITRLGLSEIRHYFKGQRLKEILWGYDKAVTETLYLPLGVSFVAVFAGLMIERRSVKDKRQ